MIFNHCTQGLKQIKSLKTSLIVAGTAGLMLVAAYGNGTQATNAASPNASATKTAAQINQDAIQK